MNTNMDDKEEQLFSKAEVSYSKSKEDVWAEMASQLTEETNRPQTKVIQMRWGLWAAACLILVIGAGLFMKLYTVNVVTGAGQTLSTTLPDGSQIQLNKNSSISYAPYWWSLDRAVTLEGEAFFEVEKGELFSVLSINGTTEVLGTSLNIYARNDNYEVFCASGKVQVSHENEQTIILPGELISVNQGKLVLEEITEDQAVSWKLSRFIFNNTILSRVAKELERAYGVKIGFESDDIEILRCTIVMDRTIKLEEALEIICYNFHLNFSVNNGSYVIKKN
ncbi:MAG: FecR domain-containing protein [Flavobacteriales bacterium]|nr:FecR domain-containing protein [Flavobacteriales bacterium]